MSKNSQNIKPGQRLKLARESLKDAIGKKLTQEVFSKRINYSRNTLGKLLSIRSRNLLKTNNFGHLLLRIIADQPKKQQIIRRSGSIFVAES